MKKLLKCAGIAIVVLIVLAAVFGNKDGTGSTARDAFEAGRNAAKEEIKADTADYQELARKDVGTVENISVLIATDASNPESIANEVKRTCKKQCNINLYDDKKAFELQDQYDQLISRQAEPSQLDAWKKENYIYVADHFIGYMEFSTGAYDDFPYKDWYYKELTSQK
ncbi:MAG: hypothetical protein ACOZAK_00195 [Patescibacteria group bacterium]